MTDAQLAAGGSMYHALTLTPCACVREGPYSGKLVTMCRRRRSMKQWQQATQEAEGITT